MDCIVAIPTERSLRNQQADLLTPVSLTTPFNGEREIGTNSVLAGCVCLLRHSVSTEPMAIFSFPAGGSGEAGAVGRGSDLAVDHSPGVAEVADSQRI